MVKQYVSIVFQILQGFGPKVIGKCRPTVVGVVDSETVLLIVFSSDSRFP